MGVNNGYDIGVNGRDLILKTSGKVYVKVADKFYELNFRNEEQNNKTESSESKEAKTSDVILLDTLSNENYPGDNKIVINNDELYITKGGFYKKVNVATSSQSEDVATSYPETAEYSDPISQSNNLFAKIDENIWGIGKTVSIYDVEFFNEPPVKWNDYLFFNSVRQYFFEDVAGIDDSEFNKIFFNVNTDIPQNWIAKSKNEIESTVLKNVYKNGKPIDITEFKAIYESFWYSDSLFNNTISQYNGLYAMFTVDEWSKSLCPKTEIMIGGFSAIVTTVIGNSIFIKFKDSDVSPNLSNIQKPSGSIVVHENKDLTFIDVLKSDISVYNNSIQNEDDIHVRIGNLDSLNNHSGVGAFFNENVTIKNGPFILNADGSGAIGSSLMWDKYGNLSGTFVDLINDLSNRVSELESSE